MFACGMATLNITRVLDNDVWWILNCGRYVVETGTIPHEEFATMHEGLHYVMQQWLTAVIFWKIYSNFGAEGLINFAWLIGFILNFVYYKICLYVSNGNKKVSVMLAIVIGIIISNSFIVTRPWILSTLILMIEIFLLEKFFRERKIQTLYFLPVLSVIFVNLHSAIWSMMIIVLLPYIAESFILNFKNQPVPFKPLIISAIGIFLAGFINPYGWEGMTYVFNSYNPQIYNIINELKATSARNTSGILFFLLSALTIVAHSKKKMPLRYFFLSFGIMIMGFQALRNLFLFFMLATFPLAYAVKDWQPFDKIFNLRHKLFIPLFLICGVEFYLVFNKAANSIIEINSTMKLIFELSIIFLLCLIFFYRREGKLFSEEIFILRRKPLIALATLQIIILILLKNYFIPLPKYEPYKPAVDFLLSKKPAEDIVLWTGYNTGGYFQFYNIKTYLDARAETFLLSNNHNKDILPEYFNLVGGELDYKEFFKRYNFTHIFVTTDDIIPYLLLSNDENYKLLFEYDLPNGEGHGKIFKPVKK